MSAKVYVDVLARFTSDGRLIPKEITWKNGTRYEIQQVKDVCRAASLKAGGVGTRYTCIINGQECYIYYEDNNRWFCVEKNYGS